jgi:hypothetical protein
MEKFYQKIAESVMGTYKDNVKIRSGEYRDGTPHYVRGFTIMHKGISYARVETNDRFLKALIVKPIEKYYCIEYEQACKVYDLISDGIRKRVKMRMMLDVLEREQRKNLLKNRIV